MKLSKKMLREFCAAASAVGMLDLNQALISAVENERPDVVRALLDGGADVHASCNEQWAPHDEALCEAALRGDTPTVKVLLAAGADVHAEDGGGGTDYPLRNAASVGSVETIVALLAAGADVHTEIYGEEDAALVDAARGGHTEAVKVLLNAGAANYRGALHEAFTHPVQNEQTIQLLRADAAGKGYKL